MTTAIIQNLEKMLAAGKESALLRFSLGSEYLKASQADAAATHLQRAVELDPAYSAAWKLLGKALLAAGAESRRRSPHIVRELRLPKTGATSRRPRK